LQSIKQQDSFNKRFFLDVVQYRENPHFYLRVRILSNAEIKDVAQFIDFVKNLGISRICIDFTGKSRQTCSISSEFIVKCLDKCSSINAFYISDLDAEVDYDYIRPEAITFDPCFDKVEIESYIKFITGETSDSFIDIKKQLLQLMKSIEELSTVTLKNLSLASCFTDIQTYYDSDFEIMKPVRKKSKNIISNPFTDLSWLQQSPKADPRKKIIVDLGYTSIMSEKELLKLGQQLQRSLKLSTVYNSSQLIFSSVSDEYASLLHSRNSKVESWPMYKSPVYSADSIYLSPDSENPLTLSDLQNFDSFIIGGIVDETVQSNQSIEKANTSNTQTRNIPIKEYLEVPKGCNPNPCLAINHVVEIIMCLLSGKDFPTTLPQVLPKRLGFLIKK